MAQEAAEISTGTITERDIPTWRPNLSSGVIVGFYLLLVFIGLYLQRPPQAVSSSAALAEFSSERAMIHLREIASRPHPVGSVEHAKTLAYLQTELSRMGLEPQVQKTTAISQTRAGSYTAATVQNVAARLKGTGDGRAILLVAHFDSAPNSFGASDDGAAVSALLETLRAIQSGERLKNDLIFLFTDAEEVGLLGAQAFANEHPWFRDVKVALNFEARGTSGPSVMFETSDQNGWLISQLKQAVPHPRTNSLMYDIYRLLPNDSDYSVFKTRGVAGLNFAYIDDAPHYHTALDNVNNIDERSLQHHGSYALSLARQLGNQSLDTTSSSNSVYFDLFGRTIVSYSYSWVGPLSVIVLVLLGAVVFLGFKRKQLTLSGVGQGFLFPLASMVAAVIGITLVWQAINSLHAGYKLMTLGETYNSGYYRLGFVALTVALTSLAYRLFQKRATQAELLLGALLWWAIFLMLTSLFLRGGSYLFVWPLLFATIGAALIVTRKDNSILFSVCMVPALILFVPLIHLLLVGLTISMAAAVMIPVVLLLTLLLPRVSAGTKTSQWVLPATAAVISGAFIVTGSITSGFDAQHRKPNTVFYVADADSGQSVWASQDEKPDTWTQQFFSSDVERGQVTELFPSSGQTFLKSRAPQLQLVAPNLKVLDDTTNQDVRTIRLQITSSRQAPLMSIFEESEAEIKAASINGKQLVSETPARLSKWALRFFAVPSEGIELTLAVKSNQPLKLRLIDQSYGLPQGNDRPDSMMAAISTATDSTFVSKTFVF